MMPLIISYIALMVADAAWDWYKITRLQRQIDHYADTVFAAALYIYVSWAFRHDMPLRHLIAVAAMLPAVRWIVHDMLLNVFRKLPIDYLGEGSSLDRWLKRLRMGQFTVKMLAVVVSAAVSTLILIL